MGIRGTVRRSQDSHVIHSNVDTDIIVAEEFPFGSTRKPDEMYSVIEHFCLVSTSKPPPARDLCPTLDPRAPQSPAAAHLQQGCLDQIALPQPAPTLTHAWP